MPPTGIGVLYGLGEGFERDEHLGDLIGLGADGMTTMGNAQSGVFVQASGVRVGGATPGARNIISGNGLFGVYINDQPSTQNQIVGNFIGTDQSGTTAMANTAGGVLH